MTVPKTFDSISRYSEEMEGKKEKSGEGEREVVRRRFSRKLARKQPGGLILAEIELKVREMDVRM